MTTRTVSPEFIAAFNALLDEANLTEVTVVNPFARWTKTDVINQIPNTETVLSTVSCPHTHKFYSAKNDNCGLCVPCILRILGLLASDHTVPTRDLSIYDGFGEADFEQIELELVSWRPERLELNEQAVSPDVFLRAIAEIAYFCRQLLDGREQALAQDFPELYEANVLELHRTFADEFEVAVRRLTETNPTATHLLNGDNGG